MFSLKQLASASIVLLFTLAPTATWAKAQKRSHKKPVKQVTAQVLAEEVPQPPPPLFPAQQPPSPPQVSYKNGQLLIEARNSTLGDVLNAVKRQTGLPIEVVSGDTTERVVGRIGPASTRSVLSELLNGTHFNYVMLSSPTAPEQVTRVLLSARTGPESAPQPGAIQTSVNQQPTFQQPPQIFQGSQATPPDAAGSPEASEENSEPGEQPEATEGEPQRAQPPQDQPQSTNPGEVKTPEQLLQQLQQQQQQFLQRQRQQQQGQQGGTPQQQPQ